MAGGKGGSQTTTQEVPEWQKKEIMEAIQKAKAMNIPYSPFTGIDVVAPAEGLNNNLNLGLGAFGLNPMQSVLPEAVSEGGLRGYRSHDIYQDNLEKFKTMYPDIYRRIDALVNEPTPASTGTINPVTGMPIVPEAQSMEVPETTASVPGYRNDTATEEREHYAKDLEAQMTADTSGRLRRLIEENDPSGYINPFEYIFGSRSTPHNELPGISQNPATKKWIL